MKVKSLSPVRLFVTPWTVPARFPHPWEFQARLLEQDAISFSRGYSRHRDRIQVSCMVADSLLSEPQGEIPLLAFAAAAAAKSLQSCLTLCNPMDGSPPGSFVPGILYARMLESVAISFSSACMHAKSLHPCLTLCNPMDSSPQGSSLQGIL